MCTCVWVCREGEREQVQSIDSVGSLDIALQTHYWEMTAHCPWWQQWSHDDDESLNLVCSHTDSSEESLWQLLHSGGEDDDRSRLQWSWEENRGEEEVMEKFSVKDSNAEEKSLWWRAGTCFLNGTPRAEETHTDHQEREAPTLTFQPPTSTTLTRLVFIRLS